MKIGIISFTQHGFVIGENIRKALIDYQHEVWVYTKSKYLQSQRATVLKDSLQVWTKHMFEQADAIIFIGACGIAVRSIAPYVKDKTTDPAVIVLDEQGKFCISLLSGHLGGANQLAQEISDWLGAIPVITTATGMNQKLAIDVFAKENGFYISNMCYAKEFAADILAGKTIQIVSEQPCCGVKPVEVNFVKQENIRRENIKQENIRQANIRQANIKHENIKQENTKQENTKQDNIEQENIRQANIKQENIKQTLLQVSTDVKLGNEGVYIGIYRNRKFFGRTLYLTPKVITIGVGCKKGTKMEQIEHLVERICLEFGISFKAIQQVASIDLKCEEQGLLEYCDKYKLPFITYCAQELEQAVGEFTSSQFVQHITGVSNVCERSAVLASKNGTLIKHKTIEDGVTVALAMQEWQVRW